MIRRKDLTDIGDSDYQQRQGEFMFCRDCSEEFGGTRGDFFMLDIEHIMKCPECESTRLVLVKARRVLDIIKE